MSPYFKVKGSQRFAPRPSIAKSLTSRPILKTSGEREKVEAQVVVTELRNDRGQNVAGVYAECSKCQHRIESFGVGDKSVARCLVLLAKRCPKGENNFYFKREESFTCQFCGADSVSSEWTGKDFSLCPKCGKDSIPF